MIILFLIVVMSEIWNISIKRYEITIGIFGLIHSFARIIPSSW